MGNADRIPGNEDGPGRSCGDPPGKGQQDLPVVGPGVLAAQLHVIAPLDEIEDRALVVALRPDRQKLGAGQRAPGCKCRRRGSGRDGGRLRRSPTSRPFGTRRPELFELVLQVEIGPAVDIVVEVVGREHLRLARERPAVHSGETRTALRSRQPATALPRGDPRARRPATSPTPASSCATLPRPPTRCRSCRSERLRSRTTSRTRSVDSHRFAQATGQAPQSPHTSRAEAPATARDPAPPRGSGSRTGTCGRASNRGSGAACAHWPTHAPQPWQYRPAVTDAWRSWSRSDAVRVRSLRIVMSSVIWSKVVKPQITVCDVRILQHPLDACAGVDLGGGVRAPAIPAHGLHPHDPETGAGGPGDGLLDFRRVLLAEVVGRQDNVVDLGVRRGVDHLGLVPVRAHTDGSDLARLLRLLERRENRLVERGISRPGSVVMVDVHVVQTEALQAGVNLLGVRLFRCVRSVATGGLVLGEAGLGGDQERVSAGGP